jgi:transcriptional regulator with XRE-family HTH domain
MNIKTSVHLPKNLTQLEFRIKDVAKIKKIKIYELAAKIGKGSTYISKIDNGSVNTTINVLQSIADALGVPVHELIKLPEGYGHFYVNGTWEGIRKV